MPATINQAICPKCRSVVKKQNNESCFWCSCGRHWQAPSSETPEIDHSDPVMSVEVPDIEKPLKKARRGQISTNFSIVRETRAMYLRRSGLIEADIMLDESGREYWLKDNFNTGITTKMYLPTRLSKQKEQ